MAVRHGSKVSGILGNVLGVVLFIILVGSALLKNNITSLIVGIGSPAPASDQIVVNPIKPQEVPVSKPFRKLARMATIITPTKMEMRW